LHTPGDRGHFVQFHDSDTSALSRNVARYLAEGLNNGEGAIVIATAANRAAFLAELEALGVSVREAVAASRLLILDAQSMLGEFMIDGQPDWDRFHTVIGAAIATVKASAPTGLRAYGEMVGLLWTGREYIAAIRLEEFWNRLITDNHFSLFCAYPIDIFSQDFQINAIDALLCDHTHLIPHSDGETLENAILRALDDHLGERADGIRPLIKANYRPAWAAVPKAEGMILWIRNNLADDAEEILKLARQYYSPSSSVLNMAPICMNSSISDGLLI
jgi:hypothetical protein